MEIPPPPNELKELAKQYLANWKPYMKQNSTKSEISEEKIIKNQINIDKKLLGKTQNIHTKPSEKSLIETKAKIQQILKSKI